MPKATHSDDERWEWVQNDEGLYDLYRTSRLGKRAWLRKNRALIDEVIDSVTTSTRPQHYLKYGG